MRIKYGIMAALALCLVASCVEPLDVSPVSSGEIAFNAVFSAETKAQDITLSSLGSFVVDAYNRNTTTNPYMSSVVYTGEGNPKVYSSATPYYWPSNALDFYAYATGSAVGQVVKNSYNSFTVTPASNPADQVDLLFACSINQTKASSTGGAIPLNFRQTGSRIVVKAKNNSSELKFQVTGWRVGYLATTGTFTHPGGSTAGAGQFPASAWSGNTSRSASNTYTSDFTASPFNIAASATTPVALTNEMILVPQVVTGANAYASTSVGAAVNGSYVALEIKIMANDAYSTVLQPKTWAVWPVTVNWEPGKQYTYTVDLAGGGYYLTNQDSDIALDPILENGYASFADVDITPWNVNNDLGLAMVTDLSYTNVDGTYNTWRSTANSYVVRQTGYYAIPLVYGNGVKGGAINAAAYTSGGGAYQADFVNHLGNTLSSPYIELNAGCTAASAALLWQTSPGMITRVQLMGGSPCRFILVEASDIPVTNGDAVIAVYDGSGNVMWSWMLWLTQDNLSAVDVTNHDSVHYGLMGENLGAIWNGASRDVASGARCVNPYYQWGRKDPMAPCAAYDSYSTMQLYMIDGSSYNGYGNYGVADDEDAGGTVRSVANSIRMPEKFFLEYNSTLYNWNNLSWFNNFWNAACNASGDWSNNQASAIKTIYDPCPPGWTLPAAPAFTGFTTTGSNTSTAGEFAVVGSFQNGWFFKRSTSDATGMYFPASGYRYRASGGVYAPGSGGDCWSYAPYSQAYARDLYFNSGSVFPAGNNERAYGFSVRPCQEQ